MKTSSEMPFELPAIDNGLPNPSTRFFISTGGIGGGPERRIGIGSVRGGLIGLAIEAASSDSEPVRRGGRKAAATRAAKTEYPDQIVFDVKHGMDFVRMIRSTIELIEEFNNEVVFPDSEMGLVITDEELDDAGIFELIVTIAGQSRVCLSWRKLTVGKVPAKPIKIIELEPSEAEGMAILVCKTHDIMTNHGWP